MADRYSGTILPQSSDVLENQKAILDLLRKINEVATEASAANTSTTEDTVTVFEPVVFAGYAPNVAAGATYINYTVGEGVNTYIDTHGAMNAATGIWTCPIAGKYRITVTRHVGSGTEGRDITNLFLNNAQFGEIVESWGQYDDVDGSETLNLLYGDTIKIVKHSSVSKTGSINLYIERIQIDATVSTTVSNVATSVLEKPLISGQIGTAMATAALVGPVKIAFDEFWVNQGGMLYDAVNRRFYVPKTGKYRVTMNPFKNTVTTGTRVLIGVNNDAPTTLTHKGSTYSNATAAMYQQLSLDSVVDLKAGDYIVFYLLEGQLYNVVAADKFNQFSIEYIEPANTQVSIYTEPVTMSNKGTILSSYSETDNVTRTFSTTWATGMTWGNNYYRGNSKLFITLHIPGRVDGGNGWAGWYTELLYSINGGSFVSLGHSGYDSMIYNTTSSITSNNYQFLLPITTPGPCYIQFATRHKSYAGTLYINGSHEIVGDEFMSKLIVLEIANDAQVIDPSYGAYYRPAFYRYNTTDNVANQYIHLKTNQTMNSVMFAVQFQGYEYGSGKPIDATVVGYPYGPSNDVINKGTSGTHTCGSYKSSDGCVVLTIYVASTYFLGLILNQIGAGPQGLYPLIITAATHTSSATGAY